VVTWIHLTKDWYSHCVRLEHNSSRSRDIKISNIDDLTDTLKDVDHSKRHIVFLDGYTSAGSKHIDVQQACYNWVGLNRKNRRLVVVCSIYVGSLLKKTSRRLRK
jgi:hypothetical protein